MKNPTKHMLAAATLAAGAAFGLQALAHNHMGAGGHMDHSKMSKGEMTGTPGMAAQAGDTAGAMAEAEVRRIDKANGKITLRHGEIKQLDMPPMTMVFDVNDKALLDQVKPGDQVTVRLVHENGKMTVTEIKPRQ